MNHRNAAALATVLLLAAAPALAQEYEKKAEEAATTTAETHLIVEPGEIDWQPAPPALPAGASMAILAGDLAKEGPFIFGSPTDTRSLPTSTRGSRA